MGLDDDPRTPRVPVGRADALARNQARITELAADHARHLAGGPAYSGRTAADHQHGLEIMARTIENLQAANAHITRSRHPGDQDAAAWMSALREWMSANPTSIHPDMDAGWDDEDEPALLLVPRCVWWMLADSDLTHPYPYAKATSAWHVDGSCWHIRSTTDELTDGPLPDHMSLRVATRDTTTGVASTAWYDWWVTPDGLDDAQRGTYRHLRSAGVTRDEATGACRDVLAVPAPRTAAGPPAPVSTR